VTAHHVSRITHHASRPHQALQPLPVQLPACFAWGLLFEQGQTFQGLRSGAGGVAFGEGGGGLRAELHEEVTIDHTWSCHSQEAACCCGVFAVVCVEEGLVNLDKPPHAGGQLGI